MKHLSEFLQGILKLVNNDFPSFISRLSPEAV